MSMVGLLIRKLRLERDYSQAGLCRGICAPSYLSKIEQGQAEARPEILERLLAALGVTYCREPSLLAEAREQLAAYYEAREREEPPETEWLDSNLERLIYSDLCLDLQLYQLFRLLDREDRAGAEAVRKELSQLLPQMDREQSYRFWTASAAVTEDTAQCLEYLQAAERQKPCAYVVYSIACMFYHLGQYSRSIEAAARAYSLAAEQGDLYVLANASFLLGSCYTDRDLDFAEKYYARAIRLGKGQWPQMADWAAYNLGASYLEWGQPEKALYWLDRTKPIAGNDVHNLLLCQKRAILYAQTGKPEQALTALAQAEGILQNAQAETWELDLLRDMLEFVRKLLHGGEADPAYETLLLRLYRDAGEKLGFGFRRFYGLFLADLYRKTRRYKDALRIMEEINRRDFPE